MEEKIPHGEMVVKVSGQVVYNAVKNYLNNNEQLRTAINAVVKQLVDGGHLQDQVERLIKSELAYHSFKFTLNKAIEAVVKNEIKPMIQAELNACIAETLKDHVFVIPKLNYNQENKS